MPVISFTGERVMDVESVEATAIEIRQRENQGVSKVSQAESVQEEGSPTPPAESAAVEDGDDTVPEDDPETEDDTVPEDSAQDASLAVAASILDTSSTESAVPEPERLVEEMLAQGLMNQAQVHVAVTGSGVTYYVDCDRGDDGNSGTAPQDAWATLEAANRAKLRPGDRLRLKRGCRWQGPLAARWHGMPNQPIVISAYGEGALPVIRDAPSTNVLIQGSYLVIENLHATLSSPPNPDPECKDQPVAWKAGFAFQDGAAYNTVQLSVATNLAIGIYFGGDTHHNRAISNTITNNHVVWELEQEASLGAMGVLLQGDSQEVAHNYFADNETICTYTGVVESNSIELYAATNSSIHHNVAFGDRVFSEMGSSPDKRSENNTYAYNLHVSSISHARFGGRFVVTRGWDHLHGPVLGTRVFNNTVYLTGGGSKGVTCERCDTSILTLENNILWVNREPFSSDGPFIERNNLYWSGDETLLLNRVGFELSEMSLRADPLFVDPAAFDFALRRESPALERGTVIAGTSFDYDLGNTLLPTGAGRDIGAYERRYQSWQQLFMLPARIEAEEYRGGAGVGYFDMTSGNSGGQYREDDVDIEVTEDEGGGFDIGWIDPGEWLAYEIMAPATGVYEVTARVATPSAARRFRIEVDGVDASGSVVVPRTGDYQGWSDVKLLIPLSVGRHTLRFVAETDRFNLNYLTVRKVR